MTEILPKAGGTLDQDPEFMRDLRAILKLEHDHEKIIKHRMNIKKAIEEGSGVVHQPKKKEGKE